jgi:ATP-dependent exoDNAse (exonuclease V) alpha subunit
VAIYYLDVSIISRGKGQCATAAAAYRSGQCIHDDRTGLTFDYTRRRSEIEAEIHAPAGSPSWVQDRQRLWNEVERAERRGDAQLSRELKLAIPIELDREQGRQLVRTYVQEQFVARGMVADVAFHWETKNPHAHIMLTMRAMTPDGLASKKNREWNTPELLQQWREQWAVQANRSLERAGHEQRIDHRSYAEQGLELLPQVHLGPDAHALEQRGIQTEKGDQNRLVAEHNAVVVDLEKARKQKQRLEAEKACQERFHARVRSGWLPNNAAAVADLEYHLGGGEVSPGQVSRYHTEQRNELDQTRNELVEIAREGERLERAADLLAERDKAAGAVARQLTPLATVKRWFSEPARKEFKQAQENLRSLDEATGRAGTRSHTELYEQQRQWQERSARVPQLKEKAERLSSKVELAQKAMSGFAHEWDRQARRAVERDRDRGMEYER